MPNDVLLLTKLASYEVLSFNRGMVMSGLKQYLVTVTNAEGKLLRKMYVWDDSPENAVEWGHDWANLFSVQCKGYSEIGWKIAAQPVDG
jgi:hypothetical protein